MKPFQFKRFSIKQSKEVFRVGTDGVLLGALSSVAGKKQILEVGTGTGLISLMIAQRNTSAEITAIDISSEASELAGINFKESPYSERLTVLQQDFNLLNISQKFDLIVSNPPFFEENSSAKDVIARQQRNLDFKSLIEKSAEILSEDGLLSVIIPSQTGEKFIEICRKNGLCLQRKVLIKGTRESKTKRLVLEAGFKKREIEISEFIIEKSPRQYSDQYLELTKEFHIFSQNSLLK